MARNQPGSEGNCDNEGMTHGSPSPASPAGDQRSAPTRANPHGLTQRERDVLELLARGHRDAEIATALGISTKTASNHVAAIIAKLGVRNRTQAAAYAQPRQTNPER